MQGRRNRPVTSALAVAMVSVICLAADAADRSETSLSFAPANLSFYSSFQNGREIYDRVANSNAVGKIKQAALLQAAKQGLEEADVDMSAVWPELIKPENKELMDLLVEMLSEEMFIYGDDGWEKMYAAYFEMYREIYGNMLDPAQFELLIEDDADELSAEMMERMVDLMIELELPTTVIGAHVADTERAQGQLARLEKLLVPLVNSVPEIKGSLKRTKVGGSEILTFTLTGKMIPWDEVATEVETPEQRKVFEKIKANVEKRQLVVTLGVHGHHVLLSVAPDLSHLTNLGNGKLLVDRDELKPLAKAGDNPFVSVSFVSKEMMAQTGFGDNFVDSYVAMGKLFAVAGAYGFDEDIDMDFVDAVRKDIEDFGEDIKSMLPEPGALMSFSFLSERGIEGYTYDWSENKHFDGSKPLQLLNHTGGRPLLLLATREKYSPENYEILVKWIKRSGHYIDMIAKTSLEGDELKEFNQAKKVTVRMLSRMDKANREMLMPGFRDGEAAVVVDAKAASKRWCDFMPPADTPLPMVEMALLRSVSDAELVKNGFAEYGAAINQVLKTAHEMDPDNVPPISIPPLTKVESKRAEIYQYPLPVEWGVSDRIAFVAALSKRVAVVSSSPQQVKRILKKQPVEYTGPLANPDRPMVAAVYFDWAGMVDAIAPWVEYGEKIEAMEEEEVDIDLDTPGLYGRAAEDPIREALEGIDPAIAAQLKKDMFELVKCFRSFSSVTTIEGDAQVTHFEWHFVDVP